MSGAVQGVRNGLNKHNEAFLQHHSDKRGELPCELLHAEATPMSVVNITATKADLGIPKDSKTLMGHTKRFLTNWQNLGIMKVCAWKKKIPEDTAW